MSATATHGRLFEQLRDLHAGLRNNLAQAIRVATDATYDDAKGTTLFKDRTGDLRRSIGETIDGLSGTVFRGRKRYFGFVANGTPPHVIEARDGGKLRFVMNGQVMFRKRVNHPGTAPRPFMQHAYNRGAFVLAMAAPQFVDSAVRRFNA